MTTMGTGRTLTESTLMVMVRVRTLLEEAAAAVLCLSGADLFL